MDLETSAVQATPNARFGLPAVDREILAQPNPGYPRDATIAALFEEIAHAIAPRPALTFGADTLSYGDLNARANRLAHALRRAGVGPDTLVGCIAERSPDMIVALVAILKAGGGYVPLDPDYPAERLSFLLADTGCRVVVGPRSVVSRLPGLHGVEAIATDDIPAGESELNPSPRGSASSIAYVMYTSGSTGKPKGVVAENRAVVRLVRNQTYCEFGPDETWLHFAPLAFDASTLEIWGALLNGGRLVIAPQRASLPDLGRLIVAERVTSLWLTSGLFNLVAEQQVESLKGVRQLLAGGDVLSPGHIRRVLEGAPGITVINGYGPTENTTFTCCHTMAPGAAVPDPVPIGTAIAHTTVYILDAAQNHVAPGAEGELYTGGDGVARGYLNDPEATAQKFLPDPFSGVPGARMYRTGDLARWRRDGTVEFIGRVDSQVKILGHRIELGEIEGALGEHKDITQSCVVAHADGSGSKRLIAYYIARAGTLTPTELRAHLAARLPRYMIPALLVPLCAMPLNANGKIDRAALPKPGGCAPSPASSPLGQSLEAIIGEAWQRAIASGPIGLDDNFFDIGGDSLRLISVHAELERSLGREIAVMDLFEATTIRALAKKLSPLPHSGTGFALTGPAAKPAALPSTGTARRMGADTNAASTRAEKQRAAFQIRRPTK